LYEALYCLGDGALRRIGPGILYTGEVRASPGLVSRDFSGSCIVTSRNSLIHNGATTATKSERFDAEGVLPCCSRDASEREHAARMEEQRRKVGTTAEVFVADNLRGASGFGWRELRQLWTERGGRSDDLIRAVRAGPWELKREADGELCVYSGSYFEVDDDLTEVQRRRVRRLVYEGMSERLARAQVPVPRGSAHEPHADGCAD
jgi:hypothetical protein